MTLMPPSYQQAHLTIQCSVTGRQQGDKAGSRYHQVLQHSKCCQMYEGQLLHVNYCFLFLRWQQASERNFRKHPKIAWNIPTSQDFVASTSVYTGSGDILLL